MVALEETKTVPIKLLVRRFMVKLFASNFGTAWETLLAVLSVCGCIVYVYITYYRYFHPQLSVRASLDVFDLSLAPCGRSRAKAGW